MSEYLSQPDDEHLPEQSEPEVGFVNGEVVPLEVGFLQNEANINIGAPDHLQRMANDEVYLRDSLRGQVFALEGRFFIAAKTGSYTTEALDLMVILAYSRRDLTKQPAEAHLYELGDEDLKQSLSLVDRIREEYYKDQVKNYGEEAPQHRSKTYIGIAGGKEASIARVHWHVYDLSDYERVGTKELINRNFAPDGEEPDIRFSNLSTRLGWEADQSLANRKLVEKLSQHIDGVRYDKFSARFRLTEALTDESTVNVMRLVSQLSHEQSLESFGEKSGYTIVIDSDNEVIVRVTKTKQGIVESTDHALYRQPIDKGKS